ncbi:hypothetical protein [Paenibacillus camerounensis]|uniref:hypothetical protein n=1 Tax=Paenibacillus camerounensis TaxID=1243663 RepID=UPI0012FAE6E3|nr:hypothetical protein [Paenibacillus camerounensis]
MKIQLNLDCDELARPGSSGAHCNEIHSVPFTGSPNTKAGPLPDLTPGAVRPVGMRSGFILLYGKLYNHNDEGKQGDQLICTHGPILQSVTAEWLSDRHLPSQEAAFVSLIHHMGC